MKMELISSMGKDHNVLSIAEKPLELRLIRMGVRSRNGGVAEWGDGHSSGKNVAEDEIMIRLAAETANETGKYSFLGNTGQIKFVRYYNGEEDLLETFDCGDFLRMGKPLVLTKQRIRVYSPQI